MFYGAEAFNGDISKWDVSSVIYMDEMFNSATSFTQKLYGAAWVQIKASKYDMFAGSSGSICSSAFSSAAELRNAVAACLQLSSIGDCPDGPHGPIGEWDVSGVTDMSRMFHNMYSFNHDISKWDVSSVKTMNEMFWVAVSFDGELSKWDVSSVTDMSRLYFHAQSFDEHTHLD